MASNSGSGPNDVFDVRKVRRFIELMNEYDLAEIDLRQNEQRIRLRRGPEVVTVAGAAPSMAPQPVSGGTKGAESSSAGGGAASGGDEGKFLVIRSPMVGTYYAAASPESPAFVKVGDSIGPETTVCIVEAMKVFNEIPAECSGKIVAVLATSGDPVEFNQPLFRVAPNV